MTRFGEPKKVDVFVYPGKNAILLYQEYCCNIQPRNITESTCFLIF